MFLLKLSNYVGQLPYSGLALTLGFDTRLTEGGVGGGNGDVRVLKTHAVQVENID